MADSKALSKERFGQFASGYATSVTHAKGAELDRLIDIAQPQAHWHVLDIATGGGHTAIKFAPYVNHVEATDITPAMLEQVTNHIASKKLGNITTKIEDAENLSYADNSFDLVTCRIAPHHFPHVAKFVHEAARVLKSGGLFLLQDQLLPDDAAVAAIVEAYETLRDPSHHHAYTQTQWNTMFKAAGLNVEHTEEIIKQQQFTKWVKLQGHDDTTLAHLSHLVEYAIEPAKAWMQPRAWGTEEATFVHHHIIMAGRKT